MPHIDDARTVLRNGFNGETFIFRAKLDDPGSAMFDVILEQGGSGGGNALEHVHPCADEIFSVRSGRLAVVINGESRLLGPGDTLVVARGARHHFVNANAGATEFTVAFDPPQQHLRFFANFATLAEQRPQWFSAKGDPHVLLIALVLHSYRDHLYLAGLPMAVQKLLFAVLAPLARLRGYRMEIEPCSR